MMADTKDISSSEYLVLIRSPGPEIFQGYFMCIGSIFSHLTVTFNKLRLKYSMINSIYHYHFICEYSPRKNTVNSK